MCQESNPSEKQPQFCSEILLLITTYPFFLFLNFPSSSKFTITYFMFLIILTADTIIRKHINYGIIATIILI